MLVRRRSVTLLAALGLILAATSSSARAAVDARVQGTFKMRARVTTAANVLGEFTGQVLTRRWRITPAGCAGDICSTLVLTRQRIDHRRDTLVLTRTGIGRYAGPGVFYAAALCHNHRYPRGIEVPYRITLAVHRSKVVGGIRFASAIRAKYVNRRRRDLTPCRLGPSHDAARYTGRLTTKLPSPPTATFATGAGSAGNTVTFFDSSTPRSGSGAIVGVVWNFGDPAVPGGGTSTVADPAYTYAAPGRYLVTLTVTAANGQQSSATQAVVTP